MLGGIPCRARRRNAQPRPKGLSPDRARRRRQWRVIRHREEQRTIAAELLGTPESDEVGTDCGPDLAVGRPGRSRECRIASTQGDMSDRLHQFLPHIVIHPIEGRIVKPLQSQPDKFNPLIARQLALSQESDNCHYIANIRGQSLKGAENIIAETSRRHSIYKSSEWPISIKISSP